MRPSGILSATRTEPPKRERFRQVVGSFSRSTLRGEVAAHAAWLLCVEAVGQCVRCLQTAAVGSRLISGRRTEACQHQPRHRLLSEDSLEMFWRLPVAGDQPQLYGMSLSAGHRSRRNEHPFLSASTMMPEGGLPKIQASVSLT